MQAGDIVKYAVPQDDETGFRFVLLDNPEIQRVRIKLICDWTIAPIEVVDVSEITLP